MTRPGTSYEAFVETAIGPEERARMEGQFVVVCSAAPGNPLLFVSDAFEAHTGYSAGEVVGRNLSFLQGPETEPEAVDRFRELIRSCAPGRIRITNCRKNGTPFVHECEFRPVRDAAGELTHFVAVQRLV